GWSVRDAPEAPGQAAQERAPAGAAAVAAAPATAAAATPPVLLDGPVPWEVGPQKRGMRALFGFALGVRIALIIGVPAIAFIGFGWHSWLSDLVHPQHVITQPQSIGAYSLMSTPALDAAEASTSQELTKNGATQSVVAAYGTGDTPALLLIISKGSFKADSPAQAMTEFGNAINKAGLQVSSDSTDTKANGVDFLCTTVSAPQLGSSASLRLCFWDDYDVVGAVVALPPIQNSALDLAEKARSLGEH